MDPFLDYIPEPPDQTQTSDVINRLDVSIDFLQPLADKGAITDLHLDGLKVIRSYWRDTRAGEVEGYRKRLPENLQELEQLCEQMKADLARIVFENEAVINAIAKELESGVSGMQPLGCAKEDIELMQRRIQLIETAISFLKE
ncbi:MAG: hypothetical protein ACK5GZ_15890 [Cyanobium sp.]